MKLKLDNTPTKAGLYWLYDGALYMTEVYESKGYILRVSIFGQPDGDEYRVDEYEGCRWSDKLQEPELD